MNLVCHVFRKEEIGRAAWTLLHATAAAYPEEPDEARKASIKGFLDGFAENYACLECRAHFKPIYAANPPTVNSRKEFQLWVCDRHNDVNTKLGKLQYNCQCVGEYLGSYACTEK